jgi:hypothetical protein
MDSNIQVYSKLNARFKPKVVKSPSNKMGLTWINPMIGIVATLFFLSLITMVSFYSQLQAAEAELGSV